MTWAEPTFWSCAAVLLYVYLGYPGLMWIAGRLPRSVRIGPAQSAGPAVTIVVPAHNEADVLEAKLRNLREIDYRADRVEVIVVSDGSTDETVEIARRYEQFGVRVLDLERGGKAAALNAAVAESTGELLCLCDANVLFRREALAHLVECLAAPNVGAATGDVRLASEQSDFGAGESLFYRVERQIQRGESRIGSVIGVDGGMYVVRRELFRPLAAGTLLDDFTISIDVLRQGYRIVYEPSAIATENGTPSSAAEFHRRVRVAAGSVQTLKRSCWPPLNRPVECWQYLSHKLLRWLGPYLLAAFCMTSILLAGSMPIYDAVLIAETTVAVVVIVAAISVRFRRTAVGGIPFYYVLSTLATVVGHAKGLLDRQPVAWDRTERSTRAAGSDSFDKTPACGGLS